MGPGPVALLAAAVDIQGDAVELLPVEHPHVIDALVEAARRVDRGIGEQALAAQLGGADLLQAVAGRAALVVELAAHRHFGQPQGGRRYPGAAEPSGQAHRQGQAEKQEAAPPVL